MNVSRLLCVCLILLATFCDGFCATPATWDFFSPGLTPGFKPSSSYDQLVVWKSQVSPSQFPHLGNGRIIVQGWPALPGGDKITGSIQANAL